MTELSSVSRGIFIFQKLLPALSDAYVLLQVKKGDNESNVDAIIHKVIPTEKLSKLTENLKIGGKRFNRDDTFDTPARKRGFERLEEVLTNLFFTNASNANFRAEDNSWRKEVMNTENGKKQTVLFELNGSAIAKAVQKLLTANDMQDFADRLAQKAAIVYRAVREEINAPETTNAVH